MSFPDLQFLTIEQSLADVYDFIDFVRNDLANDPDARVVLIGTNYGGSLGVWFQKLYPGVASAVWASSAPILAKIDFPSYLENVGEIIRNAGGDGCFDRLQMGFQSVEDLRKRGLWSELEQKFAICNATQPGNDVRYFLGTNAADLSYWAQHGQFRLRWIKDFCMEMDKYPKETAFGDLWREWRSDNSLYNRCFKADNLQIGGHLNATYARPWLYLMCNGLGGIGTTSSSRQPFGMALSVDLFVETCQLMFGET